MPTLPAAPAAPPPPDGEVRLEETALGATLVIDRPARRNALTLAMWTELGVLVRGLGADMDNPRGSCTGWWVRC